jgi:hypothetical protein
MRPVETIPGMEEGSIKENDGGVNSTMIYWENFYKCHSVPPAQQQNADKKYRSDLRKERKKMIWQNSDCTSGSKKKKALIKKS